MVGQGSKPVRIILSVDVRPCAVPEIYWDEALLCIGLVKCVLRIVIELSSVILVTINNQRLKQKLAVMLAKPQDVTIYTVS